MVRYLIIAGVAILLQVGVLPRFFEDPFQPNFLILIAVLVGLRWRFAQGAPAAFLLGLVEDSFSGATFGINGFAYLLVFILLNRVADRLYTDNLYLNLLSVFAATLLQGVAHLFLLLLFPAAHGTYSSLIPSLFPHAAVTAAASLPVLKLLQLREESPA